MKNQKLKPLVGSDRYFRSNGAPINFIKGQGYTVFDQNGNEYIDFILGVGPVILGHARDDFNRQMTNALSKGITFPGFGEVHSKVSSLFENEYNSHEVISLFKTSSEAVTAAIRCSMLETGRKKIIRCGFLGWHDVQLAKTPSWHEHLDSPFRKKLQHLNGMRGIENDEEVFCWIDGKYETLQRIIFEHGDSIALFAIDVYQLAYIAMEKMKKAIQLCKKNGIRILIDETKTCGRSSLGGFLSNTSITCDYIVLGKAIANGFPLAILLGKSEFIEIYREARIGGTHTKETMSLYAAIAVAKIMEKENGYLIIKDNCKKIVHSLNCAATQANVANLIQAESYFTDSLFNFKFSDILLSNKEERSRLKQKFLENGILMMFGHCSFICLDHRYLDFGMIEMKFFKAFKDWHNES